MSHEIKKAAVIGAGTMGSGIAAHIANAGVPVILMDLPQSGFGKKNALAEAALERMKKSEPAAFMSPQAMKLVTASNTDDLDQLKECDWVVEAVIEKIDVKQELYSRLEKVLKPGTIVSSNTSTIPMAKLLEGRNSEFCKNFFVTHFFNPPRYTRLLEVVSSKESNKDSLETLCNFADVSLGKGVVLCKDSPGFIANRIGTFWLQKAMMEAYQRDITIEEVDALFSRPMGIPKTGVFGLIDLVGLDLIPLINQSMLSSLPKDDWFHQNTQDIPVIQKLIDDGYTGRKGKGGFYRLTQNNGKKIKESVDLKTGEFHKSEKAKLQSIELSKDKLQVLLSYPDKYGAYAWDVLSQTLCYAAMIVDQIADDIWSIDQAMKWGYNWKYGPFELLDRIGVSWFVDKLKHDGRSIPPLLEAIGTGSFYQVEQGNLHYYTPDGYKPIKRREGVLLLEDIKRVSKPIVKNASAALWDIGDGIACLEFKSKMNSLDPEIMKMIRQSIDIVSKDFKALVIYNEGSNFSAGANLGLALFAANLGLWPLIEQMVKEGQDSYMALKYAPFPVIGAPSGMAVGGGCEVLLHCDALVAHAESYIGLVEVGVGIVPAWGGCKEMLRRWVENKKRPGGGMVAVSKVFEMIGTAKVAKSAYEAQEMLILGEHDRIVMNRDRLLQSAKECALKLSDGYQPPQPIKLNLPGGAARVSLNMAVKAMTKVGKATAYDEEITKKLAYILSGGEEGECSEEEILTMEREAFTSLIRNPKTLDRMEHILITGKPLRN